MKSTNAICSSLPCNRHAIAYRRPRRPRPPVDPSVALMHTFEHTGTLKIDTEVTVLR